MRKEMTLSGGSAPAIVQAEAARSLQLLQAIESTLSTVKRDNRLLSAMVENFEEFHDLLLAANLDTLIDPSGVVCSNLESASDIAASMYANVAERHQSACNDFRLTSDDGVADAYAEYVETVKALHDQIEILREWIATHDAVLEPGNGQVFETADALFSAIGVKTAQ